MAELTNPSEPNPTDGSGVAPERRPLRPGVAATVVVGTISALVALAAGELAAAPGAPSPGPLVAVANRVIDGAPGWLVQAGKSLFGLADKPALIVGTIIFSCLFAVVLAAGAERRPLIGRVGLALFGAIGALAIVSDAQGSWFWALLSSAVAVGAGIFTMERLTERARPRPVIERPPGFGSPTHPPVSRRGFLGWAGAAGVAAVGAGAASRAIRNNSSVDAVRASVDLGAPVGTDQLTQAVAAADADPVAATVGISPIVTPADDFYLIDTALIKPKVDPTSWRLTIGGMVDNELTFDYDQLLERAETIAPVTLSCVSNEVGGSLVGNALWQGVPLTDLLDEAGVQSGASQIASRSVDGWTCGFPTEAAYDGRTALVAVAMNGEPLPVAHGFPARLVVAGLYGYVSATKWLDRIDLTTWDDFDGYWVPRGWSKQGPIKTQSRIDTPGRRDRLEAGTIAVAGVAWAPNTGIERVEVQVDDGDWMEATLGERLGADAWVQWLVRWEAEPGDHVLRVRATDASGYTQTPDLAPPDPDGATGWHTVTVSVA